MATDWTRKPVELRPERRAALLEHIQKLTGWFSPQDIRASVAELKALEIEGLLDSSRGCTRGYCFRLRTAESKPPTVPYRGGRFR